MSLMRFRLFLVSISAAVFAACAGETIATEADAPWASTNAEIGPEGGQLRVDGVMLDVPAGALGERVSIVVRRSEEPVPVDYEGLSPVYRFEPDGLVFHTPVRVRIARAPGSEASIFWTKPGMSNAFERLESVDDGSAVTASITHFSGGFVGIERRADAAADAPGPRIDAGPPVDGSTPDASVEAGTGITCTFTRKHRAVSGCELCVLPAEETVTATNVPVSFITYSPPAYSAIGGCWTGTGPWARALQIHVPPEVSKVEGYTGVFALSGAAPNETFGPGSASCAGITRYGAGGNITVTPSGIDLNVTVSRLPGIPMCAILAGCVADSITCAGSTP